MGTGVLPQRPKRRRPVAGTPELPWRKANTDVFILPSCSFAGSLPGCSERNFSPKLKFEPGFGATGGREFEFKRDARGGAG